MDSTIERLPSSRIKLRITAEAADLAPSLSRAFEHLAKATTIKGFRPGKAPRPMIFRAVGQTRVLNELLDQAVPALIAQAAGEEGITMIEPPSWAIEKLVELTDEGELKPGIPLEFTAEGDCLPPVAVGDYRKIKIEPVKGKSVTHEIIDEALNRLAENRAGFMTVDRPAKTGDRLTIDFVGRRGGIPEAHLTSKDYPVILGSGMMIPGFEDELVGEKTGQTKTFALTFPKDYHAKELAGERVIFDVTIREVAEKQLPLLDDTLAKQFGQKSLAALRAAIKEERQEAFHKEAKRATEGKVLEAFLHLVTVDLPKSLVEREIDRHLKTLRDQVESIGASYDDYLEHLKKSEGELREDLGPSAVKAVKIGLGLGEVVKKEGLTKEKNPGLAAIERLVQIATSIGQ